VKKSELEIILSRCPRFPEPDASLEQYQTPAWIAAEMLNTACLRGDIEGMVVADLGCGTGIFAVGSALLGAKRVIAVDIDAKALELAKGWAVRLGLEIEFLNKDIKGLGSRVDTAISNPPFGVQTPHADRAFIDWAVTHARESYMLHYAPTERFVRERVAELGGEVLAVQRYKCALPHGFPFHRKEKKDIEMVLVISHGGVRNG
jgi:putative methylase